MEKIKGYRYEIEGFSDLNEFAKGILALANLKSSNQGIIDFRTTQESNKVVVIATEDNESYLESYMGKVVNKTEIEVYIVEYDDLSKENQKILNDLEDRYYEGEDVEPGYYIACNLMED